MAKKKVRKSVKKSKKTVVNSKSVYEIVGDDDEIDWLKVVGAVLIIVGIVFLLSGGAGITGDAISVGDLSGEAINWTTGIIGLVLIIGGVLLGMSGRENSETETKDKSKLEIKLMDISKGKDQNHDRAYVLIDNQGAFGGAGTPVNLGQVRKEVSRLSRDDPEYVGFVKEVYLPEFQRQAREGNDEEKRVANGFLGVFDKVIEEDEGPQYPKLDKSERREIKDAFRSWDGTINPHQKEVLNKYGLVYEPPSGKRAHPRIYTEDGRNMSAAGTPSDHRAGMNMVRDMIGLIEGRLGYNNSTNNKDEEE